MEPVPLGPEDRAILDIESETIAGHTCKVVLAGEGAPSVEALREAVAERLERAPLLKARLGGAPEAPAWVDDPAFDIARHVTDAPGDGPVEGSALRQVVAALFEQHLDRDRPLWHLDRVPLAGGGAAFVWRIHHSLADGTAVMRFARAVLWDPEPGEPAPPAHHPAAPGFAEDDARRRAHLAGFLAREFARSRSRPPFDGRIGRRRQVAFATVSLPELHDAARKLAGATLNDAVLTVVAGGLRNWLAEQGGRLGSVRVKVPVSMHHEGDQASNADSFFALSLPLAESDPVARLREVHAATAARKAEHDAEEMEELLRDLGRVSPHLEHLCDRIEQSPRAFALSVSNVPGPRRPVKLLGAPVRSVHALAEIGERHALRVAVVSAGDRLGFGFCADPAIVDDVQAMADGSEREAAELAAAAGYLDTARR